MKKLIPAIGMTLLGAALLGTSTFAWFSANKTVTATGLNLAAKADSSLLISLESGSNFSNTVQMVSDVTSPNTYFEPVQATYANGAYTFKKIGVGADGVDGKTFVDDNGTFNAPEGKTIDDYLVATTQDNFHDDVYLKYDGENATEQVTISGAMTSAGSDSIFKAYRVAIVEEVAGETTTYTDLGTIKFQGFNDEENYTVTFSTKVTLSKSTAKHLSVYAWLEGSDTNCKNANAVNGHTFAVTLSFTIPQAQA